MSGRPVRDSLCDLERRYNVGRQVITAYDRDRFLAMDEAARRGWADSRSATQTTRAAAAQGRVFPAVRGPLTDAIENALWRVTGGPIRVVRYDGWSRLERWTGTRWVEG